MILFEVFKKRRKFDPLLLETRQRIGTELLYPTVAGEDPEQKLVYFGMIAYATVFESALAAEMSPSAAHYLARMQIGKYKLGQQVIKVVEEIFSGAETEEAQAYAEFFLTRIAKIIAMASVDEGEVDSIMLELAQRFKRVEQW